MTDCAIKSFVFMLKIQLNMKLYYSDWKCSFAVYFLWISVHVIKGSDIDVWHEITACYGADNRCSQYDIQCPSGKTIVLGKMMYASKTDIQCQIGVSDCNQNDTVARCCTYDQNDTFTPFSAGNFTAVLEHCEGQNVCAGWAPRLAMFPYSSYIWIQYACIDGTNAAEMCSNDRVVGNNLFLKLNGSSVFLSNSQSETGSCSCLVTTPVCESSISATFVDLDFQRSDNNATVPVRTATTLQLYNANTTFDSINTQSYTVGPRIDRMNQLIIDGNEEIISLKNFNKNQYGLDYLMIHFETTHSPMILDCYEQGQEAHFTNLCDNTYTSTESSLSTTDTEFSTPGDPQTTQPSELTSASSDPDTTPSAQQPDHVTTSAILSSTNTEPTSVDNTLLVPAHTQSPTDSSMHVEVSSDMSSTSPRPSISQNSPTSSPSQSPVQHTLPTLSRVSSAPQNIWNVSANQTTTLSTSEVQQTNLVSESFSTPKPNTSYTSLMPSVESVTTRSTDVFTDETTPFDIGETPPTMRHYNETSNSPEHNVDVGETTKASSGVVISVTSIDLPTTETTKDDDGSNGTNGLIIGITIAVVVVVMVIVGVLVACFCIRLKRQETIRRNYIRNTNIFYSFPEDFNDTGSIKSDSPEVGRNNQAFVSTSKDLLHETTDNEAERDSGTTNNSTLRLDRYKIKNTSRDYSHNVYRSDPTYSYCMPSDNSYTSETSNETIDFVNGKENIDANIDNETVQNGLKSVTFNPSVHYATVKKEGKTKF